MLRVKTRAAVHGTPSNTHFITFDLYLGEKVNLKMLPCTLYIMSPYNAHAKFEVVKSNSLGQENTLFDL